MAETKKTRTRLSPEERREQLLQAAIDLFAERGFGEAKHADIAKRAGVSTAATFVYFPTREELLIAVVEEVARFYLALFDGIEGGKGTASDVLHGLAARIVSLVDTHLSYVLVQHGWAARFDKDLRTRFLAFQDQVLSKISEILWASEDNMMRDGRDDARILLSASEALAIMKVDGEPDEKLERFTKHTIEVVLAYGKSN
ncbi:TetR/AcrR family transcriptional regulator [Kordiimonas aquimaris]|uniref:TetR/AcrR family transcriptional regulator n=1 Tax=Kordiimonas aquimaris TaxID=707591 RepID=UPI0021D3506F|nr:TetR/AcrR family transcriptional regulator [Kordiimonas aquimaris]